MAKSEIYNNESLHKAERKEMIRECRKDKMKIMAEKILIITGGTVDYEWAKDWLSAKTYDYCIAADSGLVHADKLGIRVDYILGDYDSVNERLLDISAGKKLYRYTSGGNYSVKTSSGGD